MPWYAVYDLNSGELRSSGSSVASDTVLAERGLGKKVFGERPAGGLAWNTTTLDWDLPVAAPASTLTSLEFFQLFTPQERVALRQSSDLVVDDFMDLVRLAGSVSMDHPLVAEGLAYLVAQGYLTQARADEIGAA